MGTFNAHWSGSGTADVIHSTPAWLLAEFGLVGSLMIAAPIVVFLCGELKHCRSNDHAGNLLVLTIMAATVMSLVHELLYQRSLWLLIGLCLARKRHSASSAEPDTRSALR